MDGVTDRNNVKAAKSIAIHFAAFFTAQALKVLYDSSKLKSDHATGLPAPMPTQFNNVLDFIERFFSSIEIFGPTLRMQKHVLNCYRSPNLPGHSKS